MSNYFDKFRNTVKSIAVKTVIEWSRITNRNEKYSVVVNKVDVRPIYRKSQDIQAWRNALNAAEGVYQQRYSLYNLYENILIDGHLASTIEKRIVKITNAKLVFRQKNQEVEEVKKLIKTSAFELFLRETMNAKFWGHSLLELQWKEPGEMQTSRTIPINRRHVKPRFSLVTKNEYDIDGVDYTQPPFSDVCIEIGEPEELGLLLKCCPLVIYKRGNFGDWVEFAEVFGMPLRWATYRNEQSRSILEEALAKAGSAGYVVAPEDAKIDFLSSQGSQGNDIFKTLREALNEEISIAILGNTMTTTEAKSSGYAQSKTHENEQEEIHADDRAFILRVLSEKLTPYLVKIGYPVLGGEWSFVDEEALTLNDKLKIALKVADKVPIGNSYWYETFGIPKPKAGDLPEPKTDDTVPPKKGEKKKLKKKS